MTAPETLAERAAMVALAPGRRRLRGDDLKAMVTAAVLTELWLAGHVTGDDRARVAGDPRSRAETRDLPPEQVEMLLRIHTGGKPRKWRHWVAKDARRTWLTLSTRMGRAGLVTVEPKRFLGVPWTSVRIRDQRLGDDLAARSRAAVLDRTPVDRLDPADAALGALVAAAELNAVLRWRERRANKARIRELFDRSGPVPATLKKVLEGRRAAAASA